MMIVGQLAQAMPIDLEYEVMKATNEQNAIASFGKWHNQIRILVTDVTVPGSDGEILAE